MTYMVVLEWDPEGGVYGISVPALPGCYTWGRTKAEALESAREAIALMLEDMEAEGEAFPQEVELRRVRV